MYNTEREKRIFELSERYIGNEYDDCTYDCPFYDRENEYDHYQYQDDLHEVMDGEHYNADEFFIVQSYGRERDLRRKLNRLGVTSLKDFNWWEHPLSKKYLLG